MSLVPALALAALAGPLGGTSYASTCGAVAEPPHLMPNEYGIRASGTFGCLEGSTGMTVTVCVEEQDGLGGWFSRGCNTTTKAEPANVVTGLVSVDMMVYSTFLRTTVSATNDNGDTAGAKSAPMFWFNCACYVG
jgi:hypothetical protein